MNRQLDLQMKIEEGKQKLERWFTIDKEWAPFEINDYLENLGWECEYCEHDDYSHNFAYSSKLSQNKNYILIFNWNGYLRTNEICVGKYEQTEE